MDYKSTLNLPKTDFAMQAGLPKREPVMLEKWYEDKVYETVLERTTVSRFMFCTTALRMQTAISTSAQR